MTLVAHTDHARRPVLATLAVQPNIARDECLATLHARGGVRPLTLDNNGKEFAAFKRVERATGLRVFFANTVLRLAVQGHR